jgi:hypothetical protein
MEVKIGVLHAPRELVIESGESAEEIETRLAEAVREEGTLALSDTRGRRLLVPANRIAYVEIGTSTAGQVGFRS